PPLAVHICRWSRRALRPRSQTIASGGQQLRRPAAVSRARVAPPVVQPVVAVLPELDRDRPQQIPAPVLWTGHVAVCEPLLRLFEASQHRIARLDHLALVA